ncbi:MAG: type VI secretion system-associated protein TagF, partial [Thermoanaerobaculia bacterium]
MSAAGCFGKLPIFADFIRHNAGGREAGQFDRWLQEGMALSQQVLGRDWE